VGRPVQQKPQATGQHLNILTTAQFGSKAGEGCLRLPHAELGLRSRVIAIVVTYTITNVVNVMLISCLQCTTKAYNSILRAQDLANSFIDFNPKQWDY
jgi:hypothetical protein